MNDLVAPEVQARHRRLRLGLMIGGTVGLIPWLAYMAITLPSTYVAQNWPITWVGFDTLLIGFMTATAVLGLLRRQLLLLTAFATGVLLICDAWFDVLTAGPGQLWMSLLTAALINLPLAALLITGAVRILRLTATRLWFLDPGTPAWRLPLVP